MGTSAGFHPDHNGGQLGDEGHEGAPRAALPQHDAAGVIYAHDMEHLFALELNKNLLTK
jgi:hypothetical protein